jgi:hypothetical protein
MNQGPFLGIRAGKFKKIGAYQETAGRIFAEPSGVGSKVQRLVSFGGGTDRHTAGCRRWGDRRRSLEREKVTETDERDRAAWGEGEESGPASSTVHPS